MTTIDRNLLIILLTLITLTAIPMGVAEARPVFEDITAVPIVVGIELLIYFIGAMVINPRATVGMAVGQALAFAVIRAIFSLVGGSLATILVTMEGYNFIYPWLNPLAALFQVLVLLLAGPYMLAVMIPELIGREEAESLTAGKGAQESQTVSGPIDTSPTGGFIQVFSYQELSAQLKKNPGLEGFIIYNDEGLVVWQELPLKIDTEALTCRLMSLNGGIGRLMLESGLSRVRRCLIESRDHHVLATTLNQNFGIILIYNGRTPITQVYSRISVICKSAREFLQWKYPALPMATGMTRDRIPLEMV